MQSTDRSTLGLILQGVSRLLPGTVQGIFLFVLCLLLIPILFVQVGLYFHHFTELRGRQIQANLELARSVSATFEAHLQDILGDAKIIGTALVLQPPISNAQADSLLVAGAEHKPAIRNFTWIDPGGRVLASSRPVVRALRLGDREYVREIVAGREWVVGDLVRGRRTGDALFIIARGVRDPNGILRGIMLATVDPQHLGPVLQVQRVGQGSVGVIDRQMRIVYRYPEVAMSWETRSLAATQPFVAPVLSGREVSGTFATVSDGQRRLASYVPLRSAGWAVGAGRPEAELVAPILHDVLEDAGVLLPITVGAFLTALYAAKRLTVPIGRLRQHALALANGSLGDRVDIASPRELADLATAFNTMSQQLQDHQERLHAQNIELQAQREDLRGKNAELHHLQQQTAEEKQRLDAIIRGTSDGVVIVDGLRRIVSMNPALEAFSGWTADEAVGKFCGDVFQSRDCSGVSLCDTRCPMVESMTTAGAVPYAEVTIATKDGRRREMSASYVYVKAPPAESGYGVAIVRDIARLKEIDRLKDEFTALLCHDLRNPLAIVQSAAQVVLRAKAAGGSETIEQEGLKAILSGTRRMATMVADLVDSARLQSGRVRPETIPLDLEGCVSNLLRQAIARTDTERVRLDIPRDLPRVSGDLHHVERIVSNLLINALTYSRPGTEVLVAARATGREVVLSVRDRGVGLSPENARHVFDRYFRVGDQRPRKGLGLGLYIARMLLDINGGRIWVDSEEGEGSTFFVALPQA